MPDDVRVEVKKALALEWFGRPLEPAHESSVDSQLTLPTAALINALVKQASK
jgi:hypothetical protein